jgi:hypothetical protein
MRKIVPRRFNWPRNILAVSVCVFLSYVWFGTAPVHGLDPTPRLTRYMHKSWRARWLPTSCDVFHHAQAKQVEVEIRYDDEFRLRVRHDGKGIDAAFLSSHGLEGRYGLRGMRERATLIKGELAAWSEVNEGTEVELRVPASAADTTDHKPSWLRKFAPKA